MRLGPWDRRGQLGRQELPDRKAFKEIWDQRVLKGYRERRDP